MAYFTPSSQVSLYLVVQKATQCHQMQLPQAGGSFPADIISPWVTSHEVTQSKSNVVSNPNPEAGLHPWVLNHCSWSNSQKFSKLSLEYMAFTTPHPWGRLHPNTLFQMFHYLFILASLGLIAVRSLSVAASGGYSLAQPVLRLPVQWLLLFWSTDSRACGLGSLSFPGSATPTVCGIFEQNQTCFPALWNRLSTTGPLVKSPNAL